MNTPVARSHVLSHGSLKLNWVYLREHRRSRSFAERAADRESERNFVGCFVGHVVEISFLFIQLKFSRDDQQFGGDIFIGLFTHLNLN